MLAIEAQNSINDRYPLVRHSSEKLVLGTPMTEVASPSRSEPVNASPRSKRRTSTMSGPSSQRSKKRVIWRGKACTIALPLNDNRGARPLLTSADVLTRLEQWQDKGWDTSGFKLGISPDDEAWAGQTSRPYPDPDDVFEERNEGPIRVGVPNQAEWNAYVDHLKEEKLRALGVSLNDDGHPRFTQSSFPPSISRVPSQSAKKPLSASVQSSSAASIMPSSHGRSFSPLVRASNTSSRPASAVSFPPQPASSQDGTHRSKSSAAYASMNSTKTASLNLRPMHAIPRQRSFSQSFNLVQHSSMSFPSTTNALQSAEMTASLTSPLPEKMNARQSNTPLDQIGHHQGSQPQLEPHQQHQLNYKGTTLFNKLPTLSVGASSKELLAHPTPQSHQRNISEALQKEVDAAENTLPTDQYFVQAHVAATPLNDMPKPQHSDVLSSLQNGDDRDPNPTHVLEQPPKSPQVNSQSTSYENCAFDTTNSQAHSKKTALLTQRPMSSPWSSQQALMSQVANRSRSCSAELSIPIMSVEAEEFKFEPGSQFSFSNLQLGRNTFQPFLSNIVPSCGSSNSHRATLPRPTTRVGRLNADAPAFKPSSFSKSGFQFHSSTFNVDAPVFNPRRVMKEHNMDQGSRVDSASANDRIFSNVILDGTRKATRRGKVSKALPVRQPEVEEPTEDDEDGRVQVSAARQKRARVRDKDCDNVHCFASNILSQDDDVQLDSSNIPLRDSPQGPEGEKDAAHKSLPDMSSTAIARKDNYHVFSLEDRSVKRVQNSPEIQALSIHPGPNVEQDGNQEKVSLSPGEQNVSLDMWAADVNGANNPSADQSTASLAISHCDNLTTRTFPRLASLTSEIWKPDDVEPSRSIKPRPRSNPVTARSPEPSSPQLAGGHAEVSLLSEATDENDRKSDRRRSLEEDKATVGDAEAVRILASRLDGVSAGSSKSAERHNTIPSWDEIDIVMKQFEGNSDLGVERVETNSPLSRPTAGVSLDPSIRLGNDAPIPSSIETLRRHESMQGSIQSKQPLDLSHLGADVESRGLDTQGIGGADISDWNDALSVTDEGKSQSRTPVSDSHVSSLVKRILEDRLSPLERTLEAIQHSVELLAAQQLQSRPKTAMSDSTRHSDADDEDEDIRSENARFHRTRSPLNLKKDRKNEIVKSVVTEALAAYQLQSASAVEVHKPALEQLLGEVRHLKDSLTSSTQAVDIKTIVEEVISTHPRLRGKRVQDDHQDGASQKFKLQIDGLESMLKVANERAEEDYRVRRKVEDDLANTHRQLDLVEEEAAQYREASEEAERSLRMHCEEKESIQELEQGYSELALKNAALETTLEEYRLSHDQWRIDMDAECKRNTDLKAVLQSLRREIEESSQSKHGLRAKLERLQDDMTDVMERFARDQTSWIKKEHQLLADNKELNTEVQREKRTRQKIELDLEELNKEHKEASKFREAYEILQRENARLEALVAHVRQECRTHEDSVHGFERELKHHRETAEQEASRVRSTYEHNSDLLKRQHDSVRTSLEDQISRLQAQLQRTRDDSDESKVYHQSHLKDRLDHYSRALHEVNETKEAALAEQLRCHEKALNDLRERHARALHNASDDKYRLEAHLMEKLALSDEKVQHLEGKVADLQGRLEISSSAARAAAAVAIGKGVSETDAGLSPPPAAASMLLARGSSIPEKISRQALQESIMVLQDQLQHREQTIDSLEAELAQTDKDAPTKIKDRDTEITWLRELLGVRVDDLEEIIHALSDNDYDREAVKDAVTRLKTNLQMEQQEKERAALGGSSVFSSMGSLTQTPRALPMAAAAAWGHWRRARDSSLATLSELGNLNHQTPSRSSASAPSFLSDLLTPPKTSQRHAAPATREPPTLQALNERKTTAAVRPLRAYTGQARSMSARQAEKRPLWQGPRSDHAHPIQEQLPHEVPSTPPLMRSSNYDEGADLQRSMVSDIDDDASLVGSGVDYAGSSLSERLEGFDR